MGSRLDRAGSSVGSSVADRAPATILFPANKPSSRADAMILDRWVTDALGKFATRMNTKEDLSDAVEELVPILSIGLHEVVRQVTHHCVERGVVLEKIWRTYVELFDRVLKEMKASLKLHKARTVKVQEELECANAELEDLRRKHPQQMQKLKATLDGKFAQRQQELEDSLKYKESENLALNQHLEEQKCDVKSWFPLFEHYQVCQYKLNLQQLGHTPATTTSPEMAIAADLKRIVQVLPVEKRKQIGFFVCSLLGLRGSKTQDTIEGLMKRKEDNQRKIDELNARITELKGDRGGEQSP